MRYSMVLIAAALLGACGGEPEVDVTNASAEEVAEKVSANGGSDSFVRPGHWAATVTVESVDVPGAPQQIAQQMKRLLSETRARTTNSCLTPEEAKRPREDFFAGRDNDCRYDHFTMSGGKIDARMRCTRAGATQVMEMAGTYGPETYNMRMKMQGDAGGHAMTMKMRVDAKRIGECAAKKS